MMNEQYSGAISTFNSKLDGRLKENIVGSRKKRMLSSILKKYNNGKGGCGKKDGKGGIMEDLGKLKSTSYSKIKKALKDAKRNISDNVSSIFSKPSDTVKVDRVGARRMLDDLNAKYATDKAMDEGATILKFKNKGDKNPKKYSPPK